MTASKIEQILNLTPITLQNGEDVYQLVNDEYVFICKVYTVAKVKIKIELMNRELLSIVEGIIETQSNTVKMLWEEANTFNRCSPTIEAIRKALNLTHEEVNDIFEQAEGIML